MRYKTLFALLVLLLSCLSGCTQELYHKATDSKYHSYSETISQVLLSQDGKHLVILGPTYHYIFDAPEHFAELLSSPLHPKVQASFSMFSARANGALSGDVSLDLADCDAAEWAQAQSLGFVGAREQSTLRLHLTGKRYAAGRFTMPSSAKALNRPYTITVDEELPSGGRKALLLLTPLTVAADGVLVLVAIPLLPIISHNLRIM